MNLELKWHNDFGLQCPSWLKRGIPHGFSPSPVHLPSDVYFAKQVHGTHCLEISAETDTEVVKSTASDALTTVCPGQTIAVQTADCLPVLVVDFQSNRIASIHAGWRGLCARILSRYFQGFQGDLSHVEVLIGPAISFREFEVGPEVVSEVQRAFSDISKLDWSKYITSGKSDRSFLDLSQLAKLELKNMGIPSERVATSDICTKSDSGWNSYRRNGVAAGRNWAWIRRDR